MRRIVCVCVLKILSHELQHQLRLLKENSKVCVTEKVPSSLPIYNKNTSSTQYMTRVRTAKGSLYQYCWGLLFFLLNCFSTKCICLSVYDTLGTTQELFISRRTLRRYTAVIHLRYYTYHLFVFQIGGKLSQIYGIDCLFLIQVLINLRRYHPLSKGKGLKLMMKSYHLVLIYSC